MKFYKCRKRINSIYIENNKLTCIYINDYVVVFFKNGLCHSNKNAAYINNHGHKKFHLNGKCYSYNDDFTKKSWRRFVKMQVFK